jgi:hypothetical protein
MSTPRSTHWLPSTLPFLRYIEGQRIEYDRQDARNYLQIAASLGLEQAQAIMVNVFGSSAAEVDSVTAPVWQSCLINSAKAGSLTAFDMLKRMASGTAKEIRLLEEKKRLEAIGIDLDKWNKPPKTPDNSTTLDPNVQTFLAAIVQDQLHLCYYLLTFKSDRQTAIQL